MREVRKRFRRKYKKSVRHLRGFEGVRLRKEVQGVRELSEILTSIQLLLLLYHVEVKNDYVGDLL